MLHRSATFLILEKCSYVGDVLWGSAACSPLVTRALCSREAVCAPLLWQDWLPWVRWQWGWTLTHVVARLCLVQWLLSARGQGRLPMWLGIWPRGAHGCCWPTDRWDQVPGANRTWEFQNGASRCWCYCGKTSSPKWMLPAFLHRGCPSCLLPPWIQDQQAGLTLCPFKLTSTLGVRLHLPFQSEVCLL